MEAGDFQKLSDAEYYVTRRPQSNLRRNDRFVAGLMPVTARSLRNGSAGRGRTSLRTWKRVKMDILPSLGMKRLKMGAMDIAPMREIKNITITPEILKLIADIDEFKGHLDGH